ncbi:MAG: aminotransferase DegT [Deltaproteobacteria bacterium]|nr:MAG: aminotransferase DegT [Deltaproteobacteria bacterium]
MYSDLIQLIRSHYRTEGSIPLHAPTFQKKDRDYVLDAINSTFVSSVGEYVDRFEQQLAVVTGASRAVATVNGTTALQTALRLVGVDYGDEVITQPLTFVATANAISHLGAHPVFVDVDRDTMGLSPKALEAWLVENVVMKEEVRRGSKSVLQAYNKTTNRRIVAILPMHTFGHPCRIEEIVDIAGQRGIPVVEDAAEALGSYVGKTHCGLFGDIGVLSFNGNKIITCGGGGAILTTSASLGKRAKHITTTAKVSHRWDFEHDEIAYNFRMPNLNAALACAQLERLQKILMEKRNLAHVYSSFFKEANWAMFQGEPENTCSNYWLCAITLEDAALRDTFLETINDQEITVRPAWKLMTELPMYVNCQAGSIDNARWLQERLVNLPSGIVA